jgi:hypothetical protein
MGRIALCLFYQQRRNKQMTNEAAREVFNQVIANQTDADTIARIELCREYFTNPAFAKALALHLWEDRK